MNQGNRASGFTPRKGTRPNLAAPESVWAIEPRSVLPSHTRVSSSSATPGWAAIQSRSRISKPGTSSWASSRRNVESDGDLPKSVLRSSWSVWRCRYCFAEACGLPNRSIATSSIHHYGKRMPRRIRQSGSALRKTDQITCSSRRGGALGGQGSERFPRTAP